jgi:lipid-A-disaccharide synthase
VDERANKILIVAGEASGDLHGAEVVKALLRLQPQTRILAMGGGRMRQAGADVIIDSTELSVVGLTEVLGKAGKIIQAYFQLKRILKEGQLSLIILIDFPDFNLFLAKTAKRAGIPVFYYISPQVWAWRSGRVKKIAGRVKKMAVIFPFEVPLYKEAGVEVEFVGHPLLDNLECPGEEGNPQPGAALRENPLIALLPGSREKEIQSLLPEMVRAAEIIRARIPGAKFILPAASSVKIGDVKKILSSSSLPISVVEGQTYEAIRASALAIAASGTVTLETAILGKPMVIVYQVSPVTYWVGRAMINVKWVGLANIVAEKSVVPELLQGDARGGRIAAEALKILEDDTYRARMIAEIGEIRKKLGTPGAAERVARIALEMMPKPHA